MLAKKFRLPIGQSSIMRQKPAWGTYFSYRTLPNELAYSRYGVQVSKKVDKRAVGRNGIRRTVFDFIRREKFHLRPGFDVLFVSRKPVARGEKKVAEAELRTFLFYRN
ncbi:MAG: ribonuclease P protein component, partial [Patescibacteria group bacterium]